MPDIEQKFIVTAEGDGAKKTAEGIKEVKKATEDAKAPQEELKKKTEEVTKADQESTKEKKNLVDSLRALRSEFPLLGRAIDIVRNPITLLATGVSLAAAAFKAWLDSIRSMETRMAAFDSFNAKLINFQTAARQMEKDAEVFAKGLKTIEEGANSAAAALDGLNKKIEQQRIVAAGMEDSQLAEALANIDAVVASGKMSPVQGIRAERAARKASGERKVRIEDEANEAQLKGIGAARATTAGEVAQMEKDLPGAREELRAAREQEERDKDLATRTKADAQKEIARLQEEKIKAEAKLTGASALAAANGSVSAIENAHILRMQKAVDDLRQQMEFQAGVITGVDSVAAGSTARRERAEGRVGTLEGGIRSGRTRLGGLDAQRADVAGQMETRRLLGPARAGQERALDTRTGVAAESEAAQEARQWFQAYKKLNEDILKVMREAHGVTDAVLAEIAALKAKFDQTANQNRNGRL